MRIHSGALVAGEWLDGERTLEITDRYTEKHLASLVATDPDTVGRAVDAAAEASDSGLSVAQRVRMLELAADTIQSVDADLADLICGETGKLLGDAQAEVRRSVQLLRDSAQEALRLAGEVMPTLPGRESRLAFRTYGPVGVVAAIAPFNGPLILMAHKLGPGLAAGNGVVAKPAPETAASAVVLVDALAEAAKQVGAPSGIVNLVQGGGDVGEAMTVHPRTDLVSFTGGANTGERIARAAGLRRTVLELGSNSAAVVAEDADLDHVVATAAKQAFAHAGQICLSLQRLYVHEAVYQEVLQRLCDATSALVVGDPRDPKSHLGPVLRDSDADRVTDWVEQAVSAGATRRVGGRREGRLVWPTILTDVDETQPIVADELFGPAVSVLPFSDDDDVVNRVNAGRYGLQAGVFTRDVRRAFDLAQRLRMGGVMVNDGPVFREDAWPYGGRKESGRGTEGPRWAIREMSSEKLVVMNMS